MGDYLYSNTFLVIAVLVFVAVLLLAEGLYLVWRGYGSARARKIERRLQELNDLATAVKARNILKRSLLSELPLLQRTLIQSQRARRMHDFLRQAGLDWTVSRLLLLSGAATAIGFYLAMVPARQSMTVGLGLAAAAACLPLLFVQWKRARRMWKLGRQLPDAVDMIVRALRAGHAFSSGLQMAGDQMAEP
ncbi:MAG: type II secretion system F family protein, partial [Burkholderiaceae bacterium]